MRFLLSIICLQLAMAHLIGLEKSYAQAQSFAVIVDETVHGTVQLNPALPAGGQYQAGTVVTVTATPDDGYVLDSGYFSVPGTFGAAYHEYMVPQFQVTIDQEKHIGASFIEASAVDHINVTHDVVYAKPGVKRLNTTYSRLRAPRICPSSSSFTAEDGGPTTRTSCEALHEN
jgi:mRNA degradation ribonuclease J1/J2